MLLVAVASIMAFLLPFPFGAAPYLLLYPAVVAAAAFGGAGPGLLATGAAALCIDLFLTPPFGRLNLNDTVELARNAVFVAGGIGLSIVAGMNRAARARERRQAAATAELAEKYGIVANNPYDWEFWVSPEGRCLYNSPSCLRVTGYGPRDFETDPDLMRRIIHPEDQATYNKHWELAIQGCASEELEFRMIRRDGAIRWIGHTCQAVYDHNRRFLGTRGSNRDITDRRLAREALRQSEQRLRATMDNAGVGILEVNAEDRFIGANDRICQMLGYSRDELLRMTVHELTYPEDRAQSDEMNVAVHEGRVARAVYEKRYRKRDGSPVWVSVTVSSVRDTDGQYMRGIGVVEDISERKAAEAKLALQAEFTRLRADAAQVLQRAGEVRPLLQAVDSLLVERLDASFARIWTLDASGQVLELQASAGRYTHTDGPHGRIPVGQFKIGLIAQERRPHLTNQVLGDPRVHDQEWARREGLVAFAGFPLLLEGRLLGVAALFARHELSPAAVEAFGAVSNLLAQTLGRKQAEAALRESERQFREAFDHAPAGIVIADLDGRFVHMNQAYCEVVGYTPEELRGRRLQELIYPDDLSASLEAIRKLIAGEIPAFFLEKRYLRKDGSPVWVQVGCTLRRRDDQPFQLVIIMENIDLRKRAESALAAAKEAAEEASRAKDHFLAVLSHELRTPLTPVLAAVTMLETDTPVDPETRESLQMIHRNIDLEARLIDDLLDTTRIARGKIRLDRRPVRLAEVIRRAVEVCRPDIEARRLDFGVDMGRAAESWVRADTARLQQVFWNLLKNAIKFTPPGGCVGIRCRPENGLVIAEVNDSGEGIDPDALERIFNPFEQAEASRNKLGGLGLGLTICRALVDLHGGSIEAHSAGKGRGASFRVKLPVVPSPSTPPLGEKAAELAAEAAARSLHILLVEDNGDTARIWRRLLQRRGHRVETAGDVRTALDLASSEDFDLVISDLGLPDASGLDLMRDLRRRRPELKGIALSGYGMEADVQRSREAGFAEHLTKPVEVEQLQEAIQRVAIETG